MTETPRNDVLTEKIEELIDLAGVTENRSLIRNIMRAGLGMGEDQAERLNLKITSAALEEMRNAFRLFAPHKMAHKVTIFGSARTQIDDPLWRLAEKVARRMAEHGWFVVTGA